MSGITDLYIQFQYLITFTKHHGNFRNHKVGCGTHLYRLGPEMQGSTVSRFSSKYEEYLLSFTGWKLNIQNKCPSSSVIHYCNFGTFQAENWTNHHHPCTQIRHIRSVCCRLKIITLKLYEIKLFMYTSKGRRLWIEPSKVYRLTPTLLWSMNMSFALK